MPEHLARAACWVAERLARGGWRGWVVGGTVRDLACGKTPQDVDMASAATPEQIEKLFPRTVAVGRAFGTLIVVTPWTDLELTTFRSESGYGDARRPDGVRYGSSVEEDARRRDFTCNALYLDPLSGELRDPEGGLADLGDRRLRTVGDAGRRFSEDGLRLVRMARFEAALDLEPADGLHDAARGARGALRGVSAERVHAELARIFTGPRSARALGVLQECRILELLLPRWHELAHGAESREEVWDARLEALNGVEDPPGAELGLAVLLEVDPLGPGGEPALERGEEIAMDLRVSRAEREACRALWRLRRELAALARDGGSRAARIRALREPEGPRALALARAWASARGESTDAYGALEKWWRSLSPDELAPVQWITSADLAEAGLEPGARWGELLREAEERQLEGELATRAAALDWLARRLREKSSS